MSLAPSLGPRNIRSRFASPQVRWLAIASLAAALLSGCGSGSDLDKVIVEGTVTYQNQPIPNGEILFIPIEGTEGPVSGGPIKDGAYIAKGRGGIPVGKHRVEIRAYRPPSRAATGELAVEGGPAEQYLPGKFNQQTELQVEITSDSASTPVDFNL